DVSQRRGGDRRRNRLAEVDAEAVVRGAGRDLRDAAADDGRDDRPGGVVQIRSADRAAGGGGVVDELELRPGRESGRIPVDADAARLQVQRVRALVLQ